MLVAGMAVQSCTSGGIAVARGLGSTASVVAVVVDRPWEKMVI